jgi:hypothetical protein
LEKGRDEAEPFIISQLRANGVNLTPVGNSWKLDAQMKIDAFLNGNPNEPAQIKMRDTVKDGRNDITYEICLDHNDFKPLLPQVSDPRTMGRDWKGNRVKHYYVLNQKQTEIYYAPASAIKEAVQDALDELEGDYEYQGRLRRKFPARNGVELMPTADNKTQRYKVVAYVPVDLVRSGKPYPVKKV